LRFRPLPGSGDARDNPDKPILHWQHLCWLPMFLDGSPETFC
jgi:hypothetical protein